MATSANRRKAANLAATPTLEPSEAVRELRAAAFAGDAQAVSDVLMAMLQQDVRDILKGSRLKVAIRIADLSGKVAEIQTDDMRGCLNAGEGGFFIMQQ